MCTHPGGGGGGHRQHLFKGKKPFENTLKLTIQSFRLWHWELTTGLDGFTSFHGCEGKFWLFNVILCSSSLRPPTAWLQISSSFRSQFDSASRTAPSFVFRDGPARVASGKICVIHLPFAKGSRIHRESLEETPSGQRA